MTAITLRESRPYPARVALFFSLLAFGALWVTPLCAADTPRVSSDGTVEVPGFVFPESSFLSQETRAALKAARETDAAQNPCPPLSNLADAPAVRRCQAEAFHKSSLYKQLRDRYPVSIEMQPIGGVPTEIFTPTAGIAPENQHRVLINLHGGAFIFGSRTAGEPESIPIATVGRIKVISIDYRLSPEFEFPAASEDVEKVYRELIKTYKPDNIGIYGCSAGGVLTAQSVAWMQAKKLPRPGAVGMFCGAGSFWREGDSGRFANPLSGAHPLPMHDGPVFAYFAHANLDDPLVSPVRSAQVMASFPPSLLISSTRDVSLSSVVYTHSVLVREHVPAELHVWEGLSHAFLINPALPESREAYDVIVKFFATHLGK